MTVDKSKYDHPSYYQAENGKECLDLMIETFGKEAVRNFCLCNAFKYRFRAGKKNEELKELDLEKAKWYENKAKEL